MRVRSTPGAALCLGLALAATSTAQTPPNPAHEVTAQSVVYAVPGMDRVTVRQDVAYKKSGTEVLALDVYYPPGYREGTKLPAVVFINGVGDRPGSKLKGWGIYRSWGRLVAASGWIGVTFDARGPHDQSGPTSRTPSRSCAPTPASSASTPTGSPRGSVRATCTSGLQVLMDGVDAGVRGAVVYYGDSKLTKIRPDFPVYFVRAGRDNPRLNTAIDEMWKQAIAAGAPWVMVNAPTSQHAFDAFDETAESRRIVRETLDFYRDLFTPPAAPGPPSLAKKALSHWFGGREYPQAAKAYAEYVKVHPDDATAWMRLGVSQASSGDAAAGASLEKAVKLGANTANDLYNVACAYSLLNDKDKALAWLDRAVSAGFDDARLMETDTDLANIRDTDAFRSLLQKVKA